MATRMRAGGGGKRRHWMLAHELGRLVLHSTCIGTDVEDHANAFAAAEARLKQEKLIFVSARAENLRPQLLNAYLAYKNHLRH